MSELGNDSSISSTGYYNPNDSGSKLTLHQFYKPITIIQPSVTVIPTVPHSRILRYEYLYGTCPSGFVSYSSGTSRYIDSKRAVIGRYLGNRFLHEEKADWYHYDDDCWKYETIVEKDYSKFNIDRPENAQHTSGYYKHNSGYDHRYEERTYRRW